MSEVLSEVVFAGSSRRQQLVQRFLLIRLFTAASGPEERFWQFISKSQFWSDLLTIMLQNSMMIFISFYFTLILPESFRICDNVKNLVCLFAGYTFIVFAMKMA